MIKSGIAEYPKAVVLGALCDAVDQLNRDHSYETIYRSKGEAEFMHYHD